ncbi:MAG: nitrate- and nitrite sensing domain-containing protein [Verrucomicrobia bacterium]|nr:nitrate- and nitrite sensing domain-containing protein [Verrucomicrobiota bacterium]
MKKSTLQTKLLLLLSIPLAGILYFTSHGGWERWQTFRDYAALEQKSEILKRFGNAVHELQKERGRSAVFLSSKGAKFVTELPAQQQITAAQIARLNEALKNFDAAAQGAEFEQAFKTGMTAISQHPAKQSSINSQSLTAPESTAYFTQTIGLLLDVSEAVSRTIRDHEVSKGMTAYVNYLHAKEQTGIERAILAGVFGADKFTGDAFARFNRAVAKQEVFIAVFERSSTPQQMKFATEKVQGDAVQSVVKMRQTAVEKANEGAFGIPSNVWFDTITTKIELMKEVEDQLSSDYIAMAAQVKSTARKSLITFMAVAGIIVLLTVGFCFWTIRSITGPLRRVISDLQARSDSVGTASGQVAAASQSLAEGSSEQAASLEETSASLEEMMSMVKRNAEASEKAKAIANETRVAADTGSGDMAEMKTAMTDIKTSSSDVAKIVKAIDEIAFQTNILALNAAVEAARAGEAGAGFAVVADEVRSLAQRSAYSARETAEKIEDAIAKGERGVQIGNKVAASFEEIVTKIREMDQYVAEIASASREQAQGVSQVNLAITEIDKATQNNAASAEESAAAADELRSHAGSMKEVVQTLQQLVGRSHRVELRAASNPALTMPTPGHRNFEADSTAGNNRSLPLPLASVDGELKNF